MPITTPTETEVRTRSLSPAQLAKIASAHVWLDDEGQRDLGEHVRIVGTFVIGTPGALAFMADNADDYLDECVDDNFGSVAQSWRSIAKHLRAAS